MKSSLLFSALLFNLLFFNVKAISNIDQVKYDLFTPIVNRSNSNNENLQTDLVYFSATQKEKEIVINWKMLIEKNIAYFTVEKSLDGKRFDVVATENGAGTTITEREYFTIDFLPTRGTSYYRLSQTDLEGNTKNYEIQKVEYKIELSIFPNTNEDQYYIYGIPKETNARVTIVDQNGKEISKLEYKDNGAIFIQLDNLENGIYYIKIKDDFTEWSEIFEKR